MLTNPTTWYAGSRYVRVDQRGVKRDVLVPFHQPAQDAVGILAGLSRLLFELLRTALDVFAQL
mgnify:CR=1 FL=1